MTQKPNRFRIVVGYDFSPQAELALDRAIFLAGGFSDAEIHIVAGLNKNVSNPDFPSVDKNMEGVDEIRKKLVEVASARIAALKPPSVHTYVHTWLESGASTVLTIASDIEADLIVVGTHSKKGFVRAVLGSVSEKIVREARCPVLVIRETTWEHEEEFDIEPPCRGCVSTRQQTAGEKWWCEFHDHAPPYQSPLRSHVQYDPEQMRRMAWPMI